MIGVEQWRASIGLYHSGSHHRVPGTRQLAPIPVYHLVGITVLVLILVLILAKLLVCVVLFVIWVLVNGPSLLKGGLTHIMASIKRTSGTQLLVSMCAIGQAVTEAHSGCLERSARAMAILLIMAGDVEQNPGPTSESWALRHHFASLVTAIADPLRFALKLYSAGIIERVTKDKANLPTMTIEEKNDVLLSAVMSKVDTDPSLFHRFVDILKKDGDGSLATLGWKLEDTYNGYTTEQCTLNPPPTKQSKLSPSHIGTQPSQPPLQPSHPQSHPPPDPYNFEEFQMQLPHSKLPHLHPHPSQPLPHPLPQLHSTLPHSGIYPPPSHLQPSHPQSHHSSHTPPSHLPPPQAQPSQLHRYLTYHPTYSHSPSPHPHTPHSSPIHPHTPHCSPVHPHILHSSTTHPLPPPPIKQVETSPPPPPAPQSPFQLFISFLRSFYNSKIPLSYCKWPPVPKKKFINLAAISREGVTSTELKQFMLATLHGDVDQICKTKGPIKVEDILSTKPEEELHLVLVEGAPGVGKTTLSWEICRQWARRELFQQYTTVMLLMLRDRTVQAANNIMDLVYYTYDDEDDKDFRTNISQHIKQTRGKDTLIILEGLDELPKHFLHKDQPSIFTRLLSRKTLPDATILITSRPSATVQLRKGWEISRHIEVLGFTEKDITDYIQNALSPQEFPAFDSYLSTNPNIRLTMYIPLNCAIVVEVYRSCQQSGHPPPKTTTELYTCLVQTILLRYLDSHPDYKEDTIDVDKFTDLPLPVYQHFYKLIQMAYDGIQSQQLTFHDQRKTIQHLGFMDAVMELFPRPTKHSTTYSYNFLHLSLQEYLAAYYISLKSVDIQQQLLKTMRTKPYLKNMGRFLAGITKYQGMDRATVKTVTEQECMKGSSGTLYLTPYTLQLLHESGDYSIIDGHSSYHCELTGYSPLLDFAVLAHCIANSSNEWRLMLGVHGQEMQSTDRIAMLVQTLNNYSNRNYTIEEIQCCYDAPEHVQHLLLELPQHALQQIQTLVLYSSSDNPHPLPLPLFEHILSKMSRLHELWLWFGAVSTTGAVAMAELIKNNNTLQYVTLRYNAIGAEGVEALKKIRKIKKDLVLDIHQ